MSGGRRLLLDLQGSQDPRNGDRGIGRVVAELAVELEARHGAVAALLLNPELPIPAHLPPQLRSSASLRWNTIHAIDEACAGGPVAYHLMSPFEMGTPGPIAIPEHALRGEIPLLVTLYDLIPLHDPGRRLPGALRRRYEARAEVVRSAELVLCISEHTRLDAVERLGLDSSRCVVTGAGAAARFRPSGPSDDPAAVFGGAFGTLRGQHLLCVSGGDERKNTRRLIGAYSRLPAALRRLHRLVVACDLDPGIGRDWAAHAAAVGLDDSDVLFTGFVTEAVLVALYQTARLVVMPSLDEGYGLPVAEAIACERPVVTSDVTALPEILDLPESTFDPCDEAQMSAVLERGLTDDAFRARLLEAGARVTAQHRWPAVADRVMFAVAAMAVVAGNPDEAPCPIAPGPASAAGTRPGSTPVAGPQPGGCAAGGALPRRGRLHRLALVGPMPPVASGVADYNARVAAELAVHADVDVLSPALVQRPAVGADLPWRHLPAEALGRTLNPASYHAIVYTMGNSHHHIATRALALRHPGTVWFHDVRLAALYRNIAEADHPDDPRGWMRGLLQAEYGGRLSTAELSEEVFDRDWVNRHDVLLAGELARSARGIVVNSRLAERLLRQDQPPRAPSSPDRPVGTLPPLLRLEHAVATPPAGPPVERATDPPLIATFGNVDWIKAPDRLLEALAAIAPATGARLAVVGSLANVGHAELERSAQRLGIGDRLELTGAVDEAEWWRLLRRATVAVQLRRMTNGEASGAIASAQAVGTPVITNILGAAEEYPPGAVLAIDNDLRPGGLEAALMRLVGDPMEWRRHSEAGLAHARRCTFAAEVGLLLDWLATLRPAAVPS